MVSLMNFMRNHVYYDKYELLALTLALAWSLALTLALALALALDLTRP